MRDKLISVVVTCYNHEKYIEECLNSVFQQSYSNIELLVYNDGSSDNSGEVIEECLKKSPFFKTTYIYQENAGLVITRNEALKQISGDYVLFVDSDNRLEKHYIRELLATAKLENADIVYTNIKDLETGQLLLSAQEFQLDHLYVENFIESCSLIRTAIIGDLTYDINLNHKKLEDYDFFLNLIINNNAKAVPCYTTHLNYRVLVNSMSARDDIGYYYDVYAYILGKYFDKNSELGQYALRTNFQRLHHLLMNRLEVNKVSIYYDRGNGFSESEKSVRDLHLKDEFTIELDDDIKRVRVDFGELPVYFSYIYCSTDKNEVIAPLWTNSIQRDYFYLFSTPDPQVIYDVEFGNIEVLTIRYEIYNLLQTSLSDKSNHFLNQLIRDCQSYLIDTQKCRSENEFLRSELERTYYELETLTNQHHAVIGSRRWIIPTKILNFLRRNK